MSLDTRALDVGKADAADLAFERAGPRGPDKRRHLNWADEISLPDDENLVEGGVVHYDRASGAKGMNSLLPVPVAVRPPGESSSLAPFPDSVDLIVGSDAGEDVAVSLFDPLLSTKKRCQLQCVAYLRLEPSAANGADKGRGAYRARFSRFVPERGDLFSPRVAAVDPNRAVDVRWVRFFARAEA